MISTPIQVYTTTPDPEQVFQEVRHTLALHPELLDASSEQLSSFMKLESPGFEIDMALEVLRDEDGELLA